MNESEVQTPSGYARISIEERKSVFSAYADPVPDAETAKQRIESYRTRFADSTHCVWAYLCERAGVETRSCNDDGEPRGTAGMPVLRAIQYSGLVNVLVVVIRYYGGIKLGAGGLMRAYGKAASSVLEAVPRIVRVPERVLELTVSYASIGAVQRLYAGYGAEAISQTYTEQVCCVLRLPWSVSEAFLQAVTDATHGGVHVRDL